MKTHQELDSLILSLATRRWQKTAMIVAKSLDQLNANLSEEHADKVAHRIGHLASSGQLESRGDLSRWRHSEIRLPSQSN